MPVPSPRNKILPARGNYADLVAEVASLLDGEICYAIDQDQYYQNEGGSLVAVGATKAQGILADSAVQPGDNVSDLVNDAGYITSVGAPVQSVAGKTGVVTLVKADITDFSDADYATAAQGALADSATQPGDNVSTLTNDAGYITSAGAPVQSVNSQTGVVILDADDIDDAATINKFTTAADISKLAGIESGAQVNVATDLTYTAATRVIASSTGTDATLTLADGTNAGLMTSADFTKLGGIEAGAEVNVNADWNAVSGDAEILNKPTLVTNLDGLSDVTLTAPSSGQVLKYNGSLWVNDTASGSVPDGDKGDITVSSGGTVWTIDNSAVTYAKIQNVSATDKLLGRSTAGAGVIEEVNCTAAGRALLDDADAAAQRTTLGLGTLATQNGTFSGTSSGTNTGDQTITLTGDVTGSGTGSFAATIANDAVTYAKIQNVSATDKLLGRSTAGAGDVEEITCTAAGRAILDDVDAAAQRTTLGLGTIATLAAPSGSVVGTTDTQTLTNKTLGALKETVFTITDGASVDLNPANGPIQVWTLGANRTATASSFTAGQSMMLMVADGTAYTLTWPTMTWVGGSAPTLATTGYTVVELWKVSTTLYGAHVGDVA